MMVSSRRDLCGIRKKISPWQGICRGLYVFLYFLNGVPRLGIQYELQFWPMLQLWRRWTLNPLQLVWGTRAPETPLITLCHSGNSSAAEGSDHRNLILRKPLMHLRKTPWTCHVPGTIWGFKCSPASDSWLCPSSADFLIGPQSVTSGTFRVSIFWFLFSLGQSQPALFTFLGGGYSCLAILCKFKISNRMIRYFYRFYSIYQIMALSPVLYNISL